MPTLAANLTLLYTEWPFLDRFAAAAQDGFTAVECQFPYDHPPQRMAQCCRAAGLQMVLINAPAGDWAAGERGFAGLPGRQAQFRDSVLRALEVAQALDCPRVHLLAGVARGDEAWRTYRDNLTWAAQAAQAQPVSLLIEPLNPHDQPGYLLQRQADAHALVQAIGAPNLKVQLDFYHCARTEGDVAAEVREHLPGGRIGHVQIAGVPHRHEPSEAELTQWLPMLDAMGWNGFVGCEYVPRGTTRAGLSVLQSWR